ADLTGSSQQVLADQLEMIMFMFNNINEPEPALVVSHRLFHAFILKEIANFEQISISELEFGAEDAERDEYLELSFMDRPGVTEIVQGKRSIILGDRGSGKSAIFEYIKNPERFVHSSTTGNPRSNEKSSRIILSEDDPSSFINSFMDNGV